MHLVEWQSSSINFKVGLEMFLTIYTAVICPSLYSEPSHTDSSIYYMIFITFKSCLAGLLFQTGPDPSKDEATDC